MAGYCGYSKSNNAVWAEENNCFPASVLARKLKVTTEAVKACMEHAEWHHTSSWFNQTYYYDGSLLIPLARNIMPEDFFDEDDLFEAADLLLKMRSYKSVRIASWIDDDCYVRWIEWSGSRRRPKATEYEQDHCRVEFNGKSTYKIATPSGYKFTKRKSTNGFYVKRSKDYADSKIVA